MINENDVQPNGPRNPAGEPNIPDDPHPGSPESIPDPQEPDPYPMKDPLPGSDPDTEPIHDPGPAPSFPEPMPGGPPDVLV